MTRRVEAILAKHPAASLMRAAGRRLRAARQGRGSTARAVAEAAGINRATVLYAESGYVSFRTAGRLARVYGLRVEDLYRQ